MLSVVHINTCVEWVLDMTWFRGGQLSVPLVWCYRVAVSWSTPEHSPPFSRTFSATVATHHDCNKMCQLMRLNYSNNIVNRAGSGLASSGSFSRRFWPSLPAVWSLISPIHEVQWTVLSLSGQRPSHQVLLDTARQTCSDALTLSESSEDLS